MAKMRIVGLDDTQTTRHTKVSSDGHLYVNNYIWNTITLDWEAATGSLSGGNAVTINNFPSTQATSNIYDDVTACYKISDLDNSGDPKYYGFLSANSQWYIMRDSSGSYRYVKGLSGYSTAWNARAGQSYDYFDVVF